MVQVVLDTADAAVGASIGLATASLGGIRVSLRRDGAAQDGLRVASTGADGIARFTGLLEGTYTVAAERAVLGAERLLLPPDAQDVTAFAGGSRVAVRPGTVDSTALALVAGRAGSIVISEIWPHRPRTAGGPYHDGVYLELYNNGDTVAYLDGMLFGAIPPVSRNFLVTGAYEYCDRYRTVRSDSTVLPLNVFVQFPGTGRDYAIAPGQAIVVAQDAIDHRPFATEALDLSRADFEAIGDERDVDNPAVPNVSRRRGTAGFFGRGFPFGNLLPDAYVLARKPAAPLVTRTIDPENAMGTNLPFVSRADVLDAVFLTLTPELDAELAATGLPAIDCPVGWHPTWERATARILNANEFSQPRAFVRRSAFVRADGRVVLQRTRTSARDWVFGPPATPGVVR